MKRRLPQTEFIALIAFLFGSVAFSVDAMLPALPQIGGDLSPANPNHAQFVLTSLVLGLGVGTLFVGPLSDAFGRRIVILSGLILYITAAFFATKAQTLEGMLVARVAQGMGAAAPRVVGAAIIRDLYKGREMARITSFVMMIFILIPSIAPTVGQGILLAFGWRGIFAAFLMLGVINMLWYGLRQEETLPTDKRRPLSLAKLSEAAREVFAHKDVRIYIAVLSLGFGQMFAMLSVSQQIYSEVFDRAASFPYYFGLMGLLAGTGSLLNARLVMRLGMRRIATTAYASQSCASLAFFAVLMSGLLPHGLAFPAFFLWTVSVFFMTGVTFGNLMALSLEPMGHIAGMASTLVGAVSTIAAVAVAAPVGLAFNGTVYPLVVGIFACSLLAYLLMRRTTV